MRSILFVAELGSGFGHVRRLLPVARAAAAAGYRPVFIAPNPAEVAALTTSEGFDLRAAPPVAVPASVAPRRGAVATSYADILGGSGFAHLETTRKVVSHWDATLAELRPAAVVCESSPFLLLACFGGDLPVLSLGHGFILPPPHLPRFSPLWQAAPLYAEPELLDIAASVCRARGRRVPEALPAILAGTAHAVTGLDVLDPYRSSRRQPAVGPPALDVEAGGVAPAEDVFAYLVGDATSSLTVLAALAATGLTGRAFVRRGTEAHRRALAGSRITWLDRPAPTRDAFRGARLIVHHGSMLTTEEALAAGKPQVVVPLYLEHLLTAHALLSLGVASVVRPAFTPAVMQQTIAAAAGDPSFAGAARTFSDAYWRSAPSAPDLPARLLAPVLP